MGIGTVLLAALALANGGHADREGTVAFHGRLDAGFGAWTTTNSAAAPVDFAFTNLCGVACLRVSRHAEGDRGTFWGFTSEPFAVTGGESAYLELLVRGTYRLHLCESPWRGRCCRLSWHDEKGTEIGEEKFAVMLPGEAWKRARVNVRVPEGAVYGRVTIGAQHPKFRNRGEYLAIAEVRLVTGAAWIGGDGDGPLMDILTPSPNADLNATVRFRLVDATGVDHAKTRLAWSGEEAGARFAREGDVYACPPPAGGWKRGGVYRLTVESVDTLGNGRTEKTLFYFEEPATGGLFTLRDDGVFLRGGKPFFPLGIARVCEADANGFSLDEAVRQCKEAGFNAVSRYGLWKDFATADAWFDLVERHGLMTIADSENTRARDDDEARIRNVLHARRRSSVMIWEVADDTSNFRTGDEVRNSHHFVKALDGRALSSHVDAVWPRHAETYRQYVRTAEVFQFELYPFHSATPWNRSRALADLVASIERVRALHRETGAPEPGFIGIVQNFRGWTDWKMVPTYDEVRAMSYLAVIHGCRGLRWYAYSGMGAKDPTTEAAADDPRRWAEMTRLVKELGALARELTARDARVQPEVTVTEGPARDAFGRPSVSCLLKDVPGGFLMAANHTTNEVTVAIRGGGVDVMHAFKGGEVLLRGGCRKQSPR